MWHWCNLATKESGLECTWMNNDDFTVLVSGGGRQHWVSMCTVWMLHSQWLQTEQWICIKFCIKLGHSSMETIQMIQKAAAMGNWWLAASSGQCAHSCITFPLMQSFLAKHQITQVTQPPSSPDLVICIKNYETSSQHVYLYTYYAYYKLSFLNLLICTSYKL